VPLISPALRQVVTVPGSTGSLA